MYQRRLIFLLKETRVNRYHSLSFVRNFFLFFHFPKVQLRATVLPTNKTCLYSAHSVRRISFAALLVGLCRYINQQLLTFDVFFATLSLFQRCTGTPRAATYRDRARRMLCWLDGHILSKFLFKFFDLV